MEDNNERNEANLKQIAFQLAAQLPPNLDDAIQVLRFTEKLYRFMDDSRLS